MLAWSVEVQAEPTKDVNVVNDPNVNVLNNVDTTITNDATNPVPVTVQNGNNEKELVEIVSLDVASATTLAVYTVPLDKQLIITDVIISSPGDGFPLEIQRDGAVISRIRLEDSANGTYDHSYVSGIQFQENEILSIRNGGGATTNWELRGYQVDVNGS